MPRLLPIATLVLAAASLSACAERVQLENHAIYVQAGPYEDYCWMYGQCYQPPVAKQRPVTRTSRREPVLIRKN